MQITSSFPYHFIISYQQNTKKIVYGDNGSIHSLFVVCGQSFYNSQILYKVINIEKVTKHVFCIRSCRFKRSALSTCASAFQSSIW